MRVAVDFYIQRQVVQSLKSQISMLKSCTFMFVMSVTVKSLSKSILFNRIGLPAEVPITSGNLVTLKSCYYGYVNECAYL